ncbi:hypothetical protein D0T84_07960 [Dysgonomonas sp. 521]|uniref:hypothetical protein n=1 Tax=Dysgonomonas sp. 521 TaxID=2302932 RepID=UPI0013D6E25E|nr:hypothetical protein [Dysgonomonas sp. 521]NDV94852.1 hypothetical protein [Dysgonomonas sp. 521]
MNLNEFTINKSQCELYKIRHQSGMYWADITLDYKDKTGRIQIASDYGSWQNYWGACGCSFKEFLTKIDMWYFAGKVGESDWFDSDATHKRIKKDIIESRRGNDISEDEARDLWDVVNDMFIDICGKESYWHHAYDNDKLWRFYREPYAYPCITDISPQFKRFWNEAWVVFINQIKEEITDLQLDLDNEAEYTVGNRRMYKKEIKGKKERIKELGFNYDDLIY